jgi:tetratricopeptide (TPR) repeat protein
LVLGASAFSRIPDLSRLTKLRKLSVHMNKLKTLTALPPNLEELTLDYNPWNQLPDLSTLKKLKNLSLEGVIGITPNFDHLQNLEKLNWRSAKLSSFPEGILKLSQLRGLILSDNALRQIPDLSALQHLEVLMLERCQLERLPEGLLNLPKLAYLFLADNPKLEALTNNRKDSAHLEVLETLKSRGVKFTFEDDDDNDDADTSPPPREMDTQTRKVLRQIKLLNKKANNAQTAQPPRIDKALESYDQVLVLAAPQLERFADDFGYDHLFALQGKLWCTNELAESDPTRVPEAIALAEHVLAVTEKQFNFYYSEAGALARGAQTLAHNSLSWYLLQGGHRLEEALEHVNVAIKELDYTSEDGAYAVVLENKVRILQGLGRHDDAHAVVYQMHRQFPELPFFAQIVQTPEYKRWDAEN